MSPQGPTLRQLKEFPSFSLKTPSSWSFFLWKEREKINQNLTNFKIKTFTSGVLTWVRYATLLAGRFIGRLLNLYLSSGMFKWAKNWQLDKKRFLYVKGKKRGEKERKDKCYSKVLFKEVFYRRNEAQRKRETVNWMTSIFLVLLPMNVKLPLGFWSARKLWRPVLMRCKKLR